MTALASIRLRESAPLRLYVYVSFSCWKNHVALYFIFSSVTSIVPCWERKKKVFFSIQKCLLHFKINITNRVPSFIWHTTITYTDKKFIAPPIYLTCSEVHKFLLPIPFTDVGNLYSRTFHKKGHHIKNYKKITEPYGSKFKKYTSTWTAASDCSFWKNVAQIFHD